MPNVRPRAIRGAVTTERSSRRRRISRCSGSLAPATIISSVTSRTYCVLPVRATAGAPVSASSGVGQRSCSSRAIARLAGSTWAVATSRRLPPSSSTLTEHQSAISGTAIRATLASVCS